MIILKWVPNVVLVWTWTEIMWPKIGSILPGPFDVTSYSVTYRTVEAVNR
jgi:hypothetical protein